jgi:hypothetical protein
MAVENGEGGEICGFASCVRGAMSYPQTGPVDSPWGAMLGFFEKYTRIRLLYIAIREAVHRL